MRVKCDEWLGMLDAFVDDELGKDAREGILRHARACEKCAAELKRAETLKKLLAGLTDGVPVPLGAQVAWRSAIKAEARKKRARGLYRTLGAVAAACVVLVGVATGMNLFGRTPEGDPAAGVANVPAADQSMFAFIATDGDEGPELARALPHASAAADRTSAARIVADDMAEAVNTVRSLVDEFNGSIDESSINASAAYLSAFIPAGEYEAFADSLSYAGSAEISEPSGEAGDMVCVTITIQEN